MKGISIAVATGALGGAWAIDNGKGVTPPLGWRSWNLYGANVNQQLIQSVMAGVRNNAYPIWDGRKMSLYDLGFRDVGLDDNWQDYQHGPYGPNKYTYHSAAGVPQVNTNLFPNLKSMTDYAHSLNLTAGDHCSDESCYQGDVDALISYGFDSVKLDGCGAQKDIDLWSRLINATGKAILIENCHWGSVYPFGPNSTWCGMNYYRTSGDIAASYDSVVSNLQTTFQWAKAGLSYPGCFAYPDMLEVGCQHGPHGAGDPGLSFVEARAHFGAWCIVSSPLILSHDVNNATVTNQIWPIISNTEAIAVNQAWAGFSGSVFAQAQAEEVQLSGTYGAVPAWQAFYKPVSATSTAVLIMNHAGGQATISVTFSQIPGVPAPGPNGYALRDIWNHKDMGTFTTSYTATNLASHDSAFFTITPA